MNINLLLIIATCVVSYLAFNNQNLLSRMLSWPYRQHKFKEYDRWITSGFIHADYMHLLFNMFTLYSFGGVVEDAFSQLFPTFGKTAYLIFYLLAIVCAGAPSYFRHKENIHYRALGASGAVSAVMFASILIYPWSKLYLYGVLEIPALVFGGLYLAYSHWAARNSNDNIGHETHFWGAIFGFLFPIMLEPKLFTRFLGYLTGGGEE